jgi:transposase
MDRDQLEARLEELERLVPTLYARINQLERENQQLRDENRQLRQQLEQAQRQAARQAAPFRRDERRKVPDSEKKRSGRQPGHPGVRRMVPEHVDEHLEVALPSCPHCGGAVQNCTRLEQYIEELPQVRPRVTHLTTWQGTCPRCGDVFSRHPLQTSRAGGAAKVQLGPRALALGVFLNKRLGLSMRNTCRVLREFGLSYSPGGLSQALVRTSQRVSGWFDQLRQDIRQSRAAYCDETSWWVGGPGWWLWTFTDPRTTLYRVDQSRGSQVVKEVLGEDYPGVLVSDCLATYDSPHYRKHKCLAHHLRAIAEARKRPDTPDPSYLDGWKWIFTAVRALWTAQPEMLPAAFEAERARIETVVARLLDQSVNQPGDRAIQNRLLRRRPHLLTCLRDRAVEPTNNRAERALRPAVIARKISCGNRTDRGRRCWEILASLAQTCHQRGLNFLDDFAARLPLTADLG